MKSPACIVNPVSRFLNFDRHHATFLSQEMQVLKYNVCVFGCGYINDCGYFLPFQNLEWVEKLEVMDSPLNLKSR